MIDAINASDSEDIDPYTLLLLVHVVVVVSVVVSGVLVVVVVANITDSDGGFLRFAGDNSGNFDTKFLSLLILTSSLSSWWREELFILIAVKAY